MLLDAGETREDRRAIVSRVSRGICLFEERACSLGVAGVVEQLRCAEHASTCVDRRRRGSKAHRLLREVGGRGERPACGRGSGRVLERRRHVVVRFGRREREVARSLLADDHSRELGVDRPPARRRLARGDGEAEQRMGEAQALPVELENPRAQRLVERSVEVRPDDRPDDGGGRVCERCDDARDLQGSNTERIDPSLEQLVEVGRDRQIVARAERAAPALKRGCQLECEERVAA